MPLKAVLIGEAHSTMAALALKLLLGFRPDFCEGLCASCIPVLCVSAELRKLSFDRRSSALPRKNAVFCMLLQFRCILELEAAWALKFGILGMLHPNMACLCIWICEGLVANSALYRNAVVLVAMLVQLRSSPERIYVAEVALELLSMHLHVLL